MSEMFFAFLLFELIFRREIAESCILNISLRKQTNQHSLLSLRLMECLEGPSDVISKSVCPPVGPFSDEDDEEFFFSVFG